jgi:predicted nuclease of predicted toxin-antitoxin system
VKLLANENFPRDAVEALREDGHDVTWVRTEFPGASDRAVLERAEADNRVVVTFDKDFGELSFRSGLRISCGVILFRITPRSSGFVANFAVKVFRARNDWAGHFSVIEEHRIRMIPLPDFPQ